MVWNRRTKQKDTGPKRHNGKEDHLENESLKHRWGYKTFGKVRIPDFQSPMVGYKSFNFLNDAQVKME